MARIELSEVEPMDGHYDVDRLVSICGCGAAEHHPSVAYCLKWLRDRIDALERAI